MKGFPPFRYSPKPINHARSFRLIFRGLFFSSRRRTPVSNLTSACENCGEDTRYARWTPSQATRAPPAPPPRSETAALGTSGVPRSMRHGGSDSVSSAGVQLSDRSAVLGVSAGPQRIVWRRHAPRVAIGLDAVAEELAIPSSHWTAAGRSATAQKIFWSWATQPPPRWYGRPAEKPR